MIPILHSTPQAAAWLRRAGTSRVLHVFENSCNLANAQGEVLSLVNPAIGCGPFNLVLDAPLDFAAHLTAESEISFSHGILQVGAVAFDTTPASPWDPAPAWQPIAPDILDVLAASLAAWPVPPSVSPASVPHPQDIAAVEAFAEGLAGLGPGLTPSGDDFLVGWMHAVWSRLPRESAAQVCSTAANVAAPRTTTLSAAWLRAAASGLAGERWHQLLSAASTGKRDRIHKAAERILRTGHSSGADALAGFNAGLQVGIRKPVEKLIF